MDSQMPESRPPGEYKAKSGHWLRTAFLIYGMMVVGLLGIFVVFPDTRTQQGEGAPVQTAAKAARYEAVIANWNRYRTKDARAEAR
jgi:DNA-binding cell septation regulator SpoVG